MRVLATIAFAFSAGVFLAQYLLPYAWQLPLCLCCVVFGVFGLCLSGDLKRRILMIAGGTALALLYNWSYVTWIQMPAEKLITEKYEQLSMTVLDYAVESDYGAKVTVRPEVEGLHSVKVVYYGDRALLELLPGSVIIDDVKLSSSARIRDDDITTFTSKGIFLLAYSRGDPVYNAGTSGTMRWLSKDAAHKMQEQIRRILHPDTAGFLAAILTGDKSGISEEASIPLSEASLYHILAVSGMHCAYLLGFVSRYFDLVE